MKSSEQQRASGRRGPLLVLGATGFVGRHFVAQAADAGLDLARAARNHGQGVDLICDLLDPDSLLRALEEREPAAVANLAGLASVGQSFRRPAPCFEVNATGTLNLLSAIERWGGDPYVVCVSSGEVYGAPPEDSLPATEELHFDPRSPYASSKAGMEIVCGQYAHAGLRIGIARAFNHTGPGQSDSFIASSFARQIAEAESEGREGEVVLEVGDLSPRRDFTDVRDVARAYLAMIDRELEGIFNVCSGRARPLTDIVAGLELAAGRPIGTRTEAKRLRPGEAPVSFGSYAKLEDSVSWRPEVAFEHTMSDLLKWWKERV